MDYLIDEIYVYDDRIEIKCWYSETRMKIEFSYADSLKEVGCIEEYEDVVEIKKFVQLADSPTELVQSILNKTKKEAISPDLHSGHPLS